MRYIIFIALFFLGSHCCMAQDSTVTLSTTMFDANQVIELAPKDGWIFRQGNDPLWANTEINTTGWERRKPIDVTQKLADRNGKIEGWFRIKISLDSSFGDMPMYLGASGWAASEMYVDGNLFCSNGNSGTDGIAYKENSFGRKELVDPVQLTINKEHIIAIHSVAYVPSFPLNVIIQSGDLSPFPLLAGPALIPHDHDFKRTTTIYYMVWVGVCGALSLLFWLLAFQNRPEKNLALLAACSTCFCLSALLVYCWNVPGNMSHTTILATRVIDPLFTNTWDSLILAILAKVFTKKVPRKLILFLIAQWIFMYYARVLAQNYFFSFIGVSANVVIALYYVISSWKNLRGAQWAIVAGVLFTLLWIVVWVIQLINLRPQDISFGFILTASGTFLSFPISLLVYVSIRFREIIREVQDNASRLVQVTEERKQQAISQQKILEEEVKKQTADLRDTLENLRSTQSQLIQSEKMASLGELTAGIAHEIQNPLNFVNNFSEVNKELLAELKDEIKKGNTDDASAIADDVIDNEEKINHHGKRADAIVKGMLQHSRKSEGKKELTDINALCDEYLRLSYHGIRAKDKNFNVEIKADFDESIGKINVVPQDIGRVLLNLCNNAFYAVTEKKKQSEDRYEPSVSVSTKKENDKIIITVRDNGTGIQQKVVDKIFQPFFTTKPTGQGTGLGLSLSYDIIKAHGGEIKVETKEGEGSKFVILLLS